MSNIIDICGYIVPKPSNDHQAVSIAKIAGEKMREAEITFTTPRQLKEFHDFYAQNPHFLHADPCFLAALEELHMLRDGAELLKHSLERIESFLEKSLWHMHKTNNPEDAA